MPIFLTENSKDLNISINKTLKIKTTQKLYNSIYEIHSLEATGKEHVNLFYDLKK